MKKHNNDGHEIYEIDITKGLLDGYTLLDFYYEELLKYGVDITSQGYYIIGDNICRGKEVITSSKYAADLLRTYRRDPEIKKIGYVETSCEPVIPKKETTKAKKRRKVKMVYQIDLTFKFGEYTKLDFYFIELMKYGIDMTLSGYHLVGDNILLGDEVVCSNEVAAELLRAYRSDEDIKKIGYISVPYYKESKKKDYVTIDFSKVDCPRTRHFFFKELKSYGVDIRKKGYRIAGNDIVRNNELITSNGFAASLLKDYHQMVRKRKKGDK